MCIRSTKLVHSECRIKHSKTVAVSSFTNDDFCKIIFNQVSSVVITCLTLTLHSDHFDMQTLQDSYLDRCQQYNSHFLQPPDVTETTLRAKPKELPHGTQRRNRTRDLRAKTQRELEWRASGCWIAAVYILHYTCPVRGYANDIKGYSVHSTRLWSRQVYRQDALRYDKIRCHLITD